MVEATNLSIGKVIECVMHPDSDHLHVCQVEVRPNEISQIVCGAPNVCTGAKVIVALPGAILPGDFKIKPSKIRGVESFGMLCSLQELGIEEKYVDEAFKNGIYLLDEDAPIGESPLAYLGFDDTIIDLDVPYKFLSDSAFADKKALDENIYRYHAHAEDYLPDLPKFSGDISRKLYSGYTVTYICLQFAVYMGFNEIYLLGVDFSYSKDMTSNGNHFISNYHADGDGVAGFYYEECLASYKKARQYAESKGIKIFNATRGGKLEVFPRKSLEMALKEL